jgi:hypothetical protein
MPKGVFGWTVAFGKAIVGCGFWKSMMWVCCLEARLVEQLWLWIKLLSLTSRPYTS